MKHYFQPITKKSAYNGGVMVMLNMCTNCGFFTHTTEPGNPISDPERTVFYDTNKEKCVYVPGCLTDDEWLIKGIIE